MEIAAHAAKSPFDDYIHPIIVNSNVDLIGFPNRIWIDIVFSRIAGFFFKLGIHATFDNGYI